jgi:hypothetical protein
MSRYSGRTTDDIYNDFYDNDLDFYEADKYFNNLIENPLYFKYGFSELQEDTKLGLLDEDFNDIFEFTPESIGIPNVFNINADYKGIKSIVEEDRQNVYIPSSDYCYIKCYNKFLELIKHNDQVPTKYFSPYKSTLQDIRKKVIGYIAECKNGCQIIEHEYKGKRCTRECNKIKKSYMLDNNLLLDEYKVYYDKSSNKIVAQLLSRTKRKRLDYAIGLLYLGGNEYHAILLKNVIKLRGNTITKDDITLKLTTDRTLSCDFIKNKPGLNNNTDRIAVAYDIETYTEDHVKILKRATKKKPAVTEVVKNLIPYALGYRLINIDTGEYESDYIEIIIQNKGDNLFNLLFESLAKLPYKKLQLFAHNGGRFDNIFVKKATNIEFKKAIQKGSHIKTMLVTYKKEYRYTFKDTHPFVLNTLKKACEMFDTAIKKQDFDIKDKSFEWYKEHESSTDEETDWRTYLRADVESLAQLMYKLQGAYKSFGTSILWFTGLPGVAYYLMNNYCKGMSKLYIPKDPTMVAFIKASMYGGRVLCFKRHYKMTDNEGMISADYNSLYPAAMALCSFPYGEPQLFTKDNIEDFNNRAHYIVQCTVQIPNIRYAFHPYKTEDGLLIYPSNTIIKGVYNDVDLREMMKDGYIVTHVEQGIYWNRSKRIFTNLINQLYNKRNYYKSLGEDHPEFNMEYILKICINSMFGKFNETIYEITRFECDNYNPEFMAKGGTESAFSLDNGQKEVTKKLFRPTVNKPSYIASYILAHSRSIVNEVIREIGPENVYYSDTDSLYIEKRVLTQYNLKTSKILGGFKSDYGENSKITEAIFLDTKRYFLKLDGVVDEKNKPVYYKAKFNGLSFKTLNRVSNFDLGDVDFKTVEDKMKLVESIYTTLLEQYNKRMYNPYAVDYTKSGDIDKKKNNRLVREWENKNIDNLIFATEFWKRSKTTVMIEEKEMKFQIDPHKRGQWIDGYYYALNYDLTKEEHKIVQVAPILSFVASTELITHTIHISEEDDQSKVFNLSNARPLMYPENCELPLLKSNILFHPTANNKLVTKYFVCYSIEGGKLVKNDLLHIENYIAHKVNAFGLYDRFNFNPDEYQCVHPLIGIKATKENILKYGENYVSEETMKRLVNAISKNVPFKI